MAYTMEDAYAAAPWLLECPPGTDRVLYAFQVGTLQDTINRLCAKKQFDVARTTVRYAAVSQTRKQGDLNMIAHYERNWDEYVWDRFI